MSFFRRWEKSFEGDRNLASKCEGKLKWSGSFLRPNLQILNKNVFRTHWSIIYNKNIGLIKTSWSL